MSARCLGSWKIRAVTLEELRADLIDAPQRLRWQATDAVRTLVLPNWGTERHGYDRLLYGVVHNAMALADRLSVYLWPELHDQRKQTQRLRLLFGTRTADKTAAAVAVQLWRHTLTHFGDPVEINDPRTGVSYSWLLHWGSDHLPREQHLTFADASPGHPVLAFGAEFLIDDVANLGGELMARAQTERGVADRLEATRARLVAGQRINLRFLNSEDSD